MQINSGPIFFGPCPWKHKLSAFTQFWPGVRYSR